MNVKMSEEAAGVIRAVATKRGLSADEAVELLIRSGAKRLLAMEKYAKKQKAARAEKRATRKADEPRETAQEGTKQ